MRECAIGVCLVSVARIVFPWPAEACKHRSFAVLLWALRVHMFPAAVRFSSDVPVAQFCLVCPFV